MRCDVKTLVKTLAAGALVLGAAFASATPAAAVYQDFYGSSATNPPPYVLGNITQTFGANLSGVNEDGVTPGQIFTFNATAGSESWATADVTSMGGLSNVSTDANGLLTGFAFFAMNGSQQTLAFVYDGAIPANGTYAVDGVGCNPCGDTTHVPEPGTAGVLAMAFLGLGFALNRRRNG